VSTNPAAFTAATSVVWSAELTALSMMSFVGYIVCPPTTGFLSAANAVQAMAAMLNNRTATVRFMISPGLNGSVSIWTAFMIKYATARALDW
jgi:hypothetical protein